MANDSDVQLPCLIVAHKQAEGRGRGSNVWWSSAGALTCSLLLELRAEQLPMSRWPEMSLTAGSSVCAALTRRFPGEDVRLKWPNDVYLRGAKLCGILVEVAPAQIQDGQTLASTRPPPSEARPSRVVIGVGLNVNNSTQQAPDEIRQRAIALCDIGGPQPIEQVLIDVLQEFADQLSGLQDDPSSVRAIWRQFDLLMGQTVTIEETAEQHLTGTCLGIDDDGALLLQTESGPRRCYGGVVHSFT
jgi:BirA family biotin operon repressor/biotin-[acetyl-CoA-carboxylase] ligase